MTNIDKWIDELKKSGQEIYWLGKVSVDQIDKLELLLGSRLPDSYKRFLLEFGGGGVVGSEISGIESDDAELDYCGTVYGDTLRCREEYGLPDYLVTIFFRDDEICWCLDTRAGSGEYPIVSFSLFNREIERTIARNFDEFFEEYLALRAR